MSGRVFIGLNNIAGVGTNLMKGFRQNGIKSDFYSAEQIIHMYDYPNGIIPRKFRFIKKKNFNRILIGLFLFKIILKNNYFIFIQAGWTLMKNQLDIKILRFFGKKTMVIFTGCDSRLPEKVMHFKWNPCRDCPDEYELF